MSIATTIISNYGTALYLRDASKLDIIYLSRDIIKLIASVEIVMNHSRVLLIFSVP
jgi:hypothetical protein